jgi:hypothetical protein
MRLRRCRIQRISVSVGLLGLSVALLIQRSSAQDGEPPPPQVTPDEKPSTDEDAKAPSPAPTKPGDAPKDSAAVGGVETLESLQAAILIERQRVQALRLALTTTSEGPARSRLQAELEQREKKLHEDERSFEQLATGVDLSSVDDEPSEKFDLQKELLELFVPILKEVKSATQQPRKIARLKLVLSESEGRLPVVQRALENIQELKGETKDAALKQRLAELETNWEQRREGLARDIDVTRKVLADLTRDKRSFWETSQDTARNFFRTRGLNLLTAILSCLGIALGVQLLYRGFAALSPWHRRTPRPFFVRMMSVSAALLSLIGGASAGVVALYVSGDWFLLSLALLALLGLAWAARQTIPEYWVQLRTLLNIGSIRENERVLFNGIPYEVVQLNFYTILENRDLVNSRIRLPIKDVVDRHSRPFGPEEPWFPCRVGHWVRLADGAYGQVRHQTQDMVQLTLPGGAVKTYQTLEFLAQSPVNLSQGFRISSIFGLDYSLQSEAPGEVPNLLAEKLRERLDAEGYGRYLMACAVEFKAASSSSLDFELTIDLHGDAASRYNAAARALQRYAVEACNEQGWTIPFQQLTLHGASTALVPSAGAAPSRPLRTQTAIARAPDSDPRPGSERRSVAGESSGSQRRDAASTPPPQGSGGTPVPGGPPRGPRSGTLPRRGIERSGEA